MDNTSCSSVDRPANIDFIAYTSDAVSLFITTDGRNILAEINELSDLFRRLTGFSAVANLRSLPLNKGANHAIE